MVNYSNKEHRKVLVYTNPEDGYPPEEWESIWTEVMSNGRLRVDNIPFYAKDLSLGDIIETKEKDGAFYLDNTVELSSNSTVRIIIFKLEMEDRIRKELIRSGCSIEGVGIDGLIAVNIPLAATPGVMDYLSREAEAESIDFEEGSLRLAS